MEQTPQQKVRLICNQISFLMEHQEILPDLKEITAKLNSEDSEYLKGAQDALNYLISFLEQKGKLSIT